MEDLEKARNEKCIPIAKIIFGEMSNSLVGSTDNQKDLALKVLSVMLANDLNIDTEVSYVPQLILRTLSELNTTFQTADVIAEDDIRYASIANKILKIVSDSNIRMDDATPEEMIAEFEPVKIKLNELFIEEKLTKLELSYIKDMIFDSFTELNNLVQNSIANAAKKAEEKALGVENMSDLSLKRLDEFLKS